MAITLVGSPLTGFGNNGNDASINISGIGLQENDVVVVSSMSPYVDGVAPAVVTAGYTESHVHTGAGTNSPSIGVWWKRMGATPDAAVVVSGDGSNTTDTTAIAFALRGVDTTTAPDTAATTAGETSSTNPDPASITTATDGAWVIVFAGMAVTSDSAVGTITNYSNHVQIEGADTVDHTHAAASREITTAGAENPGAWSAWDTGLWYAITTAFRPAATDVAPSVSDSVTVAEAITVDPLILADVGISDGLTVADTPTMSLQEAETLAASVSDGLGIGESVEITPLLLVGVSVSDGLTVGESTAATVSGGPIVGTIVVGEYVTVVVTEGEVTEHNVSVSDGLTIGEAVAVTPLELEDLEISDGVTVGESVSVDPLAIEADSVSDSITLGESISVTPLLLEGVNVSDGLGVGESVEVTPLLLVGVGVSDDIGIGESVTTDPLALDITAQDGLTLADTPTISPLILEGVNVSDGVTLGDTPELSLPEIGTIQVSVSDSVAISEAVTVYPPDTVIMIDHEEGDLSDWTSVAADLSVTVGAALNGTSYGLQYEPSATVTRHAVYTLGASMATDVARLRFYFDPNTLNDYCNQMVYITGASDGWSLSLSYDSDLLLRQTLYDDGGAPHYGSYMSIPDEPIYIECMVVRATAVDSNNGYSVIWINGQSDTVSGIDNYDRMASFGGIKFGGTQTVSQGAIYFDEIIVNISGEAIGGTILHINVSDGLTVGEDVTITTSTIASYDVSISDGLTVGESVTITMALEGVEVSDGLTVGEAITANTESPALTSSVSDGLTVGESLQVYPPGTIALIDHEEGDLSDWTSVTSETYITVTPGAAMNGTSYGLDFALETAATNYADYYFCEPDHNQGIESTVIHCGFWFDPNSSTFATSNIFSLQGYVFGFPWSIVNISHTKSGGQHRIQANFFEYYNGYHTVGPANITDEPHYIEFVVFRATSDVASDGYGLLYIDGVPIGTVTGVDNWEGFNASRIRLSPYENASESIFYDEITVKVFVDQWIYASDGLTVGESVNLLIPEYFLSVSDGLTIGESVGLLIPELFVTVSDGLTIGESIDVTPPSGAIAISISDGLTIGESVGIETSADKSINVSDGLTVADVPFFHRPPYMTLLIDHEEGDKSDWDSTTSNYYIRIDAAKNGTTYGLLVDTASPGLAYKSLGDIPVSAVKLDFWFSYELTTNSIYDVLDIVSTRTIIFDHPYIAKVHCIDIDGEPYIRVDLGLDSGYFEYSSNFIISKSQDVYIQLVIYRAETSVSGDGSMDVRIVDSVYGEYFEHVSGADNYDNMNEGLYRLQINPTAVDPGELFYIDEISLETGFDVDYWYFDISDSLSIGESINVATVYNLSTLDSIAISESHSVPPLVLPIDLLDGLTIGDSLTEPILWQTYGSTNNIYAIESEDRTIVVEQEDRTYSIAQEERIVIIEQE